MNDIKQPKSWQQLKDALDEARLILQCASVANEAAHGEGGGVWGVNSDFQKKIDAFLDKYGRFPTEADK